MKFVDPAKYGVFIIHIPHAMLMVLVCMDLGLYMFINSFLYIKYELQTRNVIL